jgi:AcrR family transcriptional regulator
MADLTLRERKQQRAREHIIDAAFALFAERGFAQVTVADIAERAEVGRTTFFRYFGDKQEVVFAHEESLLDAVAAAGRAEAPAPGTLTEALGQLWALVGPIGPLIVGATGRYAEHEALLADNPELQDRSNRKLQKLADALEGVLRARGAEPELATLAAQIAMACFRAAQRTAGGDVAALMPAMRRAVEQLVGPA